MRSHLRELFRVQCWIDRDLERRRGGDAYLAERGSADGMQHGTHRQEEQEPHGSGTSGALFGQTREVSPFYTDPSGVNAASMRTA